MQFKLQRFTVKVHNLKKEQSDFVFYIYILQRKPQIQTSAPQYIDNTHIIFNKMKLWDNFEKLLELSSILIYFYIFTKYSK